MMWKITRDLSHSPSCWICLDNPAIWPRLDSLFSLVFSPLYTRSPSWSPFAIPGGKKCPSTLPQSNRPTRMLEDVYFFFPRQWISLPSTEHDIPSWKSVSPCWSELSLQHLGQVLYRMSGRHRVGTRYALYFWKWRHRVPYLYCDVGCDCRRPPLSPTRPHRTACRGEWNNATTWISTFCWKFHNGGLDVLIFRGKVMYFTSFQPLLKFTVEEFRSLVRLQLFR